MPNTDKLHPRALSIRQLFTDSDAWYAIPLYQRPYRWTDDQVNALWDDLKTAYENDSEENYFLGSIITAKQPTKKHLDVIDGQQRLTTLIILFSVIRDFYPEINQSSNDDFAIKALQIKDSIANEEGNRLQIKKRLIPDDSAASDFYEIVTELHATKKTICSTQRPSKQELKGDIPKFNFINSVHILRDKADELDEIGKLGDFIDFIFNHVQVIRIDCADGESAITLFQVLNDRGMDLRSSDMVKSFLLEKLDSIHRDDTDALAEHQKQFMWDWRDMENSIADDEKEGMTMDDMLTLYICYCLAASPGKNLFKKFKIHYNKETKGPNAILKDFKRFSENYGDLFRENIALYALRYTNWAMLWKSILLTALHLKYESDDFTKLAQALRRYYYICWIAGKNLTTVKNPSFNVIKQLKDGDKQKPHTINQIDEYLRGLVTDLVNEDDSDSIFKAAKEKLDSSDVEESWIKPLLLLIEYVATSNGKPLSFIPIASPLHLEHVLPVRHNGDGWEHILKPVAKEYLNSGGNFTLLSGRKNKTASNNPFLEKIAVYKGNGRITPFQITQRIVHDYDKGKYNKEWNEDSMRARKKWFLSEVSKILGLGTWP